MIYLKSLVFGIGGAVVASVLWIMIAFVLPMWAPYVIGRLRGTGGVSTGYISSGSVVIAALIGFLVAFAWQWHRLRSALDLSD
ncbi:MAG: hypothetical protein HYS05_11630 [Acidobacteria bacterium]|nr:hypothetical protein [Acidobacteriota bacterium]